MIWHPSNSPRHAAEEAFCRDVDHLLMNRLHVHADSDEAKARLAKMPHLRDPKLVSLLSRLGITPEALVVIQLIPMVLVAWASGEVDDKERRVVIKQSRRFGIRERSEADAVLEHWLHHRPSPLLLETWRRFIGLELATLSGKPRENMVAMTRQQMTVVAKSSGGFLGFRRISSQEHRVIATLSKVLADCGTPVGRSPHPN